MTNIKYNFCILQNSLLVAEQLEMVGRMAREGKLTEDEADAMMLAFASDMAAWERALGEQQAKQRARLNERLLRRQQLMASAKKGAEEAHEDLEAHVEVKEHQMDVLQRQKGIPDKVRDEIVDRYRADVVRLHNAHEDSKSFSSLLVLKLCIDGLMFVMDKNKAWDRIFSCPDRINKTITVLRRSSSER